MTNNGTQWPHQTAQRTCSAITSASDRRLLNTRDLKLTTVWQMHSTDNSNKTEMGGLVPSPTVILLTFLNLLQLPLNEQPMSCDTQMAGIYIA